MLSNARFDPSSRIIAVVLAASLTGGCSAWRAAEQPPATAAAAQHGPMHVRVTTADGRRIELEAAVVAGDSLIGRASKPAGATWDASVPRSSLGDARIAVALQDVCKLETLEPDGGTTVLLVLSAAIVGGLAALGIVGFSMSPR
jgi:hypothetical protein